MSSDYRPIAELTSSVEFITTLTALSTWQRW